MKIRERERERETEETKIKRTPFGRTKLIPDLFGRTPEGQTANIGCSEERRKWKCSGISNALAAGSAEPRKNAGSASERRCRD